MTSDNQSEHRVDDVLESTSFSSISAAAAAQDAAHARVAEEAREARLAGYKSPVRRMFERLFPRRQERD